MGPGSSSVDEDDDPAASFGGRAEISGPAQSSSPDEEPAACSFTARWRVNDVNVWKTIMSSVASLTRNSYEKIFFQFVQFFDSRGFDFSSVNDKVMLLFLQSFVGKSKSRVRTAIMAIKFFLKIYHREDLANHPLITMFGKGAQNLAPLPREKTHVWNPQRVLDWLKTRPVPSGFL